MKRKNDSVILLIIKQTIDLYRFQHHWLSLLMLDHRHSKIIVLDFSIKSTTK